MASVKQVLTEVSNEASAEGAPSAVQPAVGRSQPAELPTDKNEELVHALLEAFRAASLAALPGAGIAHDLLVLIINGN
jgi:hypothetical protein